MRRNKHKSSSTSGLQNLPQFENTTESLETAILLGFAVRRRLFEYRQVENKEQDHSNTQEDLRFTAPRSSPGGFSSGRRGMFHGSSGSFRTGSVRAGGVHSRHRISKYYKLGITSEEATPATTKSPLLPPTEDPKSYAERDEVVPSSDSTIEY